MSVSAKPPLPIVLALILFALLPYFEGGETPLGLFLIHGIVLLSLTIIALSVSRFSVPAFLIYFFPFFLALLVSLFIAPYRYAAFLQFWDLCMAALFCILVCTLLKEYNQPEKWNFYFFAMSSLATILSVVLSDRLRFIRISGTFINPNYFAAFCLLLILFGLYLIAHESGRNRRFFIAIMLALLAVVTAFASSRSVFLAAVALAFIYLWKRKPNRMASILIVSILIVAGAVLWFRFYKHQDPFRYYRLKIWQYSLKGILEDPYLGIGLNMLSLNASRFNFPAETELGRYAKIARSADNQYLQILAECGFLGFLTFLVGWLAIFFLIRKLPNRFFWLQQSYIVLSVLALFALPLNNTSVLFLFLFLIVFPLTFDSRYPPREFTLNRFGRISVAVTSFILFTIGVYFPFAADWEFKKSVRAPDGVSSEFHLQRAVRYNPYQPYYKFFFVRRIVEARPKLQPFQWAHILQTINESLMLNPIEPEFYAYKGRIFRTLLEQTGHFSFYTEAVSSYQSALSYDPFNVFLRTEYAYFLVRSARVNLAEEELRRAISAEPVYLNARLFLAEIEWRQNRIKEAQSEFQQFQKYYKRYGHMQDYFQQGYIKKLLEVNEPQRNQLQKALFP